MKQLILSVLAIVGGISLAAQGGINAKLGVWLKNPLLASLVAFLSSSIIAVLFVSIRQKNIPNWIEIKQIPIYLWFSGGILSVIGISLYYYIIPKLGLSNMISLGLLGQLMFSIIASHFEWLGLPSEAIDFKRFLGICVIITGIILINK